MDATNQALTKGNPMKPETHQCPADGRYRVDLDPSQAFPSDPGNGTPAIVVGPGDRTGTFFCVSDTGELDGEDLPPAVYRWIESITEQVDTFVDAAFAAAENAKGGAK